LRAATVRAESIVEVAVIGIDYYEKCIKKIDQKRMTKKVEFLMKLDCFQACSKNAVVKFTYLMEKVKFKRNQKVYAENQPINKVYIVWKGEFETEARLHKRED
jgi:hypothetical protein